MRLKSEHFRGQRISRVRIYSIPLITILIFGVWEMNGQNQSSFDGLSIDKPEFLVLFLSQTALKIIDNRMNYSSKPSDIY